MNELTPMRIKKGVTRSDLIGTGGWLALFQLRVYFWILTLLALAFSPGYPIWTAPIFLAATGAFIICLVFFYLHRMAFRTLFICAAAVVIVASMSAAPSLSPSYWTAIFSVMALDILLILALFHSKRVQNTFH